MSVQNAFASVAVTDLARSMGWYEKLLGKPACRTMPGVGEWQFERGGGLQLYLLAARAGSGSMTLMVNDLEAQITHLQRLGIDTTHTTSVPQVKTVMITDPDGNHIAFAQNLIPAVMP